MANNDKAPKPDYDKSQWELETPAPVHKAPPALLDDPGFQRQMEFQDFINSPAGEKWLREMKFIHQSELASERAASKQATTFDDPDSYVPGTYDVPDVRNRAEMKKRTNDVSRQVLADEEAKLAPKYSQPLQAHTD
tara:strand:- start:866 stop:1273 length:408 start_codon:yes stop_codon:yes gene_type:complete